ncbi:hypothetical protein D1BOALGB6SA_483, partial [Olavius sp. associated proteobacterium Delta 1]
MMKLDESNAQDFFDRIVSDPANSLKFQVVNEQGRQCYVEQELWDYANRLVILHVKVPVVSAAEDTVLKLYYDETMADNDVYVGETGSAAAQNVWDDDFVLVMHMAQDATGGSAQAKDSTSNALHFDSKNHDGSTLVDGAVGKALNFNGEDEYLEHAWDGLLDVDLY